MILRIFLVQFIFLISIFSSPKKIIANVYKNSSIKKPLIVLDAGHGGLDRGTKINYPYVEEKKVALQAVMITKKYLEQYGYKVVLTRDTDRFVPLKKRAEIANNLNAEIFVSIHFNSCPNKTANGIEIFFHNSLENKAKTKHSKNLAENVLTDVIKKTNAQCRKVKKANFCVIKETKMPAILIEGGFLTNPKERDNIRKKTYLDKLSLGIAKGIEDFIKKYFY